MSSEVTTVKQLAEDVGIPAEKLLVQLQEALSQGNNSVSVTKKKIGLNHSIDPEQKQKLLEYLQATTRLNKDSASPKKITLRRRKKINLITKDNKDVVVTIRKKRTYKQRDIKAVEEAKEAPKVEESSTEEAVEETLEVNNNENLVENKNKKDLVIKDNAALDKLDTSKEEKEKKFSDQAKDTLNPASKKKELLDDEPKKKKKKVLKNINQSEVDLSGKTLTDFVEEELPTTLFDEMEDSTSGAEDKKKTRKKKKHSFLRPAASIVRIIDIPAMIVVNELAKKMAIKTKKIMKVLSELEVEAKANQEIDQETAVLIVEQLGHKSNIIGKDVLEQKIKLQVERSHSDLEVRTPVVTIMGHVDHGKTSLLDKIRQSQVTELEAGGITQHIGAYKIQNNGREITFLDTPGHAAFTAMRARGANCTDIVILVVAADDGVMPQTIEAIQHTKAAGVPIIVAINKIDKPEADIERIRSDLSQHEVISEEWGGDYMFVQVSAKSGEGLDKLLESILLQAEVLELKAAKKGNAHGIVLESKLDKIRGPLSTLLVQAGALKQGDIVFSGLKYGRVRLMKDEKGTEHQSAGPSTPIEVLGISGILTSGDEFIVVSSEKQARDLIEERKATKNQHLRTEQDKTVSTEDYFAQVSDAKIKSLNIILKTDVHGTLEALSDALSRISTDEIRVNILNGAVGGITESDINLAITAQAMVVGFNVRAQATAKSLAEKEGISIKYFNIIYDLIDTIKATVSGLLPPEVKEKIIGLAEVRDVFRSSRYGAIAGCMVVEGLIKRKAEIRVLRDSIVIYEGELESLRRFKEDVQELRAGMECGIGVKNYNDIREKDQIEVFEKIEIERKV